MNIQIINPIEYQNWDDLIGSHPGGTFFHTAAWARVLSETYRYKPLYFSIIENEKISGLLPIMEINSVLTGKRGVSLPFSDECQPLAGDRQQFNLLMEEALLAGQEAGWKHIEIRGGQQYLSEVPSSVHHFIHTLQLDTDTGSMLNRFKSNVRRNIKRAQKERLQVIFSNTWESLLAFCRLNCLTRKMHGLPPQPFKFFKNIYRLIIKKNKGFIALALHQARPVAAAIYIHFGDRGIYKYGASHREFLSLRPNNLIMWEAIKWFAQRGYSKLSLGRTEPQNAGLLQFKNSWGTSSEKLNYYRYNLRNAKYITMPEGSKTSYNFFKYMPVSFLRLTGNLLYRHVG